MVTRRNFLMKAGMVAAASSFLPSLKFETLIKETGLILYTVRHEMDKDVDATIKAVSEMGYDWIESANYSNGLFYKMKPAEFRKKVETSGMKFISSHVGGLNPSNIDRVAGDAAEAGLKYLVLPHLGLSLSRSLNDYKHTADFFNIAGEKCKNVGLKFGFHNHTWEFKHIDNQIPYDILVGNTDEKLVAFELDLCWITASGQSAVEYINKFPGRFELWHMKDMGNNKKDATMGEGTIDFKPIYALAEKAGLKYWFVEQDNCKTHSPLESARISREFLLKNIIL
jgi:sugar phosphate isomerase/epimerase